MVRPSFVPTTIRSRSDSSISWSVGLTTRSPSTMPIRTAPIGPRNGSGETVSAADTALMQRMSCAVTHVGREDRGDTLRLVAVALRPERPDGAVGHARGQDGALRGAPFALEEPAGDLAGGVHALLDVDGQREEVRAFAGLRPALRRAEHDGVAAADERLPRPPAWRSSRSRTKSPCRRLRRTRKPAPLRGAQLQQWSCFSYSSTVQCEGWKFGSALRARALAQTPPSVTWCRDSAAPSGGGPAP